MYSNEKNPGINWKDIIIKVIFLIIFVLLIIWLFPKVPNMKPFYSNIFRENISYMQDAAESYYTTERLPKKVGDKVEMTLKEMIDKNLILPFVDKDGKECDTTASYVEIVKNKTDYTLTVNLVCPSEKNKVVKTLGCHDYCENCKKEALEYEFKKAVTSNYNVYSCPNGGSLNGTKCNVYNTNTYEATKVSTPGEYYCPSGGSLNGTTCVINEGKSYNAYTATSKVTYKCEDGDKLSGTKCTKTITSTKEYDASKTVVGASSYAATLVAGKDTTYAAKATNGIHNLYGYYETKPQGYSCSFGFAPDTCSTCKRFQMYYYNCTATKTTYSCPSGGSLDATGRTCVIKGTSSYTCPSGGSLNGTTCNIAGTVKYTCDGTDKLSGTKCTKTITSTKEYNATKTGGETTKYCGSGAELKEDGKCYYTEKTTYAASKTEGKTSYTCPNGGTVSGKNCVVTNLANTYNATVTVKTATNYEYKWSSEETLEGYVRTGETRKVSL